MNKLTKSILATAAIATTLISTVPTTSANTWCGYQGKQNCSFVDAANNLQRLGIVEQNKDWNNTDLRGSISRAKFFEYISKASGYSSEGECTGTVFQDVNTSTVWKELCSRIESAAALWLTTSGPSRPYFEINKTLSRQEYATFLIRFQGYTSEDDYYSTHKNLKMYFEDLKPNTWHVENINFTKTLGLFNWVPVRNGKFNFEPERATSLGESIITINRMFQQ